MKRYIKARSQVYEIICSEKIASDNNAIQLIAKEFNISDLRYEVESSSYYYYVPHFMGNPALDNFDYGVRYESLYKSI